MICHHWFTVHKYVLYIVKNVAIQTKMVNSPLLFSLCVLCCVVKALTHSLSEKAAQLPVHVRRRKTRMRSLTDSHTVHLYRYHYYHTIE